MKSLFWIFIVLLNLIRFWGTADAPPGFYIDEAAASANVLCIQQTGSDFTQNFLPLFSPGPGGGYFTAPYLYSQVLWTSLWGDSPTAFRTLPALLTLLTILFLTLFVRKKAGERVAMACALFATISPWVFQFSRIAWDPPMAPLWIALGLWLYSRNSRWSWLQSSFVFALAAYAYPPTRVQIPILLMLLPGMSWALTFRILGMFLLFCSPVFYYSLDPQFTARTQMLAVTSTHPMNPYRHEGMLGLILVVLKQFVSHFSWDYLVLKGDSNLRHGTGHFGILSWTQAIALYVGGSLLILKFKKAWAFLSVGHRELLWLGCVGTMIGVLPAAMTWESVPHALRSIGAWPFLCMVSAVLMDLIYLYLRGWSERVARVWSVSSIVLSILFFGIFLNHYFGQYALSVRPWFTVENDRMAQAYLRMQAGESCEAVRTSFMQDAHAE